MIRTSKFRKSLPIALFSLLVLLMIIQPSSRFAWAEGGNIKIYLGPIFSFHHETGTYIFGKDGPRKVGFMSNTPDNNAANWWRINDDPKTGFTPAVLDAKMSSEYQAVTSFELNKRPYIFGLHKGEGAGDGSPSKTVLGQIVDPQYGVGANIWRINDDAKGFELKMYKGKMSLHYKHIASFQLKNEPHILGLHFEGGVNIWRIKDEGSKGLTWNLMTKRKAQMSPNYQYVKVFYAGGHPFVIGRHKDVGTNIWRVKDDATGLQLVAKGLKIPRYEYVLPFQASGRTYLLGINPEGGKEAIIAPENYTEKKMDQIVNIRGTLAEWGRGYGCIWELTPKSITKTGNCVPMSHLYTNFTTFEKDGRAYLFGLHYHRSDSKDGYANIWRVNDNPANGFTLEYCGGRGGPCSPVK